MSHRTKPVRPGKLDRLVTVWHATPAGRVPSILRTGLLPALSKGAREEVWLVTSSRRHWSLEHTKARHGVERVALVCLVVPRSWLVRRRRGLWTCARLISAACIVSVRHPAFAA
jgi:hypothetical protein